MVKHFASDNWRSLWSLDPAITFLNHGSYGACPIAVLEQQQQLRDRLEQEPVRFFGQEFEPLLDAARQALAEFVGADPAGLVFVPNATTGVNTVLRSLPFQPGDELLVTTHEYNASRNALNFAAEQTGATVIVAEIPFPIQTPEQVITAVLEKVSAKTRLVLVDQVTSQTALILPLADLIQQLQQRGIDTLVDGAHAPGMLPLNLQALGATYYTGNCHKWLCAPKGAAFLYVQPERRSQLRPLVISHGANSPRTDRSRFHLEFDWVGTADPTAYLTIPKAIQFMGSLLPGGWAEVMARNHQKAVQARQQLCDRLQVEPPCPDAMLGSMAAIPLNEGAADPLRIELFEQFQIEVPVVPWVAPCPRLLRISAQLYNTQSEYDELATALIQLRCGVNTA